MGAPSPGPDVLDVVVGFDETVQPIAGLIVVTTGPCPIYVEERPAHRRRHPRAVTTHVDVGVLGWVAQQVPHLLGVRGDTVLHVANPILRRAREGRTHLHDTDCFGLLEPVSEYVIDLRVTHPEEAQCRL